SALFAASSSEGTGTRSSTIPVDPDQSSRVRSNVSASIVAMATPRGGRGTRTAPPRRSHDPAARSLRVGHGRGSPARGSGAGRGGGAPPGRGEDGGAPPGRGEEARPGLGQSASEHAGAAEHPEHVADDVLAGLRVHVAEAGPDVEADAPRAEGVLDGGLEVVEV